MFVGRDTLVQWIDPHLHDVIAITKRVAMSPIAETQEANATPPTTLDIRPTLPAISTSRDSWVRSRVAPHVSTGRYPSLDAAHARLRHVTSGSFGGIPPTS